MPLHDIDILYFFASTCGARQALRIEQSSGVEALEVLVPAADKLEPHTRLERIAIELASDELNAVVRRLDHAALATFADAHSLQCIKVFVKLGVLDTVLRMPALYEPHFCWVLELMRETKLSSAAVVRAFELLRQMPECPSEAHLLGEMLGTLLEEASPLAREHMAVCTSVILRAPCAALVRAPQCYLLTWLRTVACAVCPEETEWLPVVWNALSGKLCESSLRDKLGALLFLLCGNRLFVSELGTGQWKRLLADMPSVDLPRSDKDLEARCEQFDALLLKSSIA